MNFDKFTQLEDAIENYGKLMATTRKLDPNTRIAHLMCMELIRDLKAERDAPSKYPGLVVRMDYKDKHMSLTVSKELLEDSGIEPVQYVADRVRGFIAEVLRP